MSGRRRPPSWNEYSEDVRDYAERCVANLRPLDECDPGRVTRLAVRLGIRPAVLAAD